MDPAQTSPAQIEKSNIIYSLVPVLAVVRRSPLPHTSPKHRPHRLCHTQYLGSQPHVCLVSARRGTGHHPCRRHLLMGTSFSFSLRSTLSRLHTHTNTHILVLISIHDYSICQLLSAASNVGHDKSSFVSDRPRKGP